MKYVVAIALWAMLAVVHGKQIIRGESYGNARTLKDMFEDTLEKAPRCPAEFSKVGCFLDNGKKKGFPEMLFQDRNERGKKYGGELIDWKRWDEYVARLVCRCAKAAKAKGYRFFAIQFFGECYSGPNMENPFTPRSRSKKCYTNGYKRCDSMDDAPCVGGSFRDFVYQLEEGRWQWCWRGRFLMTSP
ncbi:predicted protein [Nematostella vectensis]|uniref:Lysozyme n=1 Tax=Nematostella vectensis TaxID=45351 RepID=A7S5E7_NEMVE|nr:predicted protein [Nematostella vectensis]|eukprot:XP_001633136.1 predicted protein [Nematostella vectensis]